MAEQHDLAERPTGDPAPDSAPPPFPEPARTFPPDATSQAGEGYRSLSILALIGFGVSAVYAAVVLLLVLVALISRRPIPTLGWTLLIPLTAAALCMVARFRIKRSEGTLAGDKLAGWGIMLGLIVALCAGASSLAVYLALRQQSEVFANEWLDLLRKGQAERAAWRVLTPLQRSDLREDDPALRHKLLQRLASSKVPGSMLSEFRNQDVVRRILQGGPETTFEPSGIADWEPKEGGYSVTLRYHISTPECSFDAVVTVHGTDSPRAGEGRQWRVDLGSTRPDGPIVLTEVGQAMLRQTSEAGAFMGEWQQSLQDPTGIATHLLTLRKAQRPAVSNLLRRRERLGVVAGGWASCQGRNEEPNGVETVLALQRTRRGELVEFDEESLPDAETRKSELKAVRRYFSPAGRPDRPPAVQPEREPTHTRKDDRILFAFNIALIDQTNGAKSSCVLLLDADAGAVQSRDVLPDFQFVGLRLRGGERIGPGNPTAPMSGGLPGTE